MESDDSIHDPNSDREGKAIEAEPDDLKRLIDCLSSERFNGKAGNKSLRDALGWADQNERYWKAHGRALDQGLAGR